jgi:membrane peptidoglycan carboxypeptidase
MRYVGMLKIPSRHELQPPPQAQAKTSRSYVRLSNVAQSIRQALILTEDVHFRSNSAVRVRSTFAATSSVALGESLVATEVLGVADPHPEPSH